MIATKFLYFTVIVIAIITPCLQGNARSGIHHPLRRNLAYHLEECGRDHIYCLEGSLLKCIEKRCQCMIPDAMMFDEETRKCLVIETQRCFFTPAELKNLTAGTGISLRSHILDCVENAYCDVKADACFCSHYAYPDDEGSCLLKGNYSDTCDSDNPCNEQLNLICFDEKCACDSTEASWSTTLSQCVCLSVRTNNCAKYNNCVEHASLWTAKTTNLPVCKCVSGYLETLEGICMPTYGSDCNFSSKCHPNFVCEFGKCACPFPRRQFFQSGDMCISHVGGPCVVYEDRRKLQFPCVDNAVCSQRSEFYSTCECKRGFVLSNNKMCEKSRYGEKCNKTLECASGNALLECSNHTCNCEYLHTFNKQKSICQGKHGAPCDARNEDACIRYAECVHDPSQGEHPICACQPETTIDSERNCRQEYESSSEDVSETQRESSKNKEVAKINHPQTSEVKRFEGHTHESESYEANSSE